MKRTVAFSSHFFKNGFGYRFHLGLIPVFVLVIVLGFVFVLVPATSLAYERGGGSKTVWEDSIPEKSPKIIRGKASWYNAHGRFTANGERFHKDSLTCAHRTFPFGTRLRVKNIKNNREVIVRVTDRGPFGGKYCIDISIAAARILGIIRLGFAEVEITEYEETIVPLKAGPIKMPEFLLSTINVGKDYTPEWKMDPLPPMKPLK
ncbi:MAG: septal ring lytic transglycosylase RlpA family protein [Bacteroidaceae bacterium]|nr:septal ring lytic transglycosylase RlpA family protein [Bacteroidaceae bacterium]